jgi:hypothetical protein
MCIYDPDECTCSGHYMPGVMHVVPCCDEPHIDDITFEISQSEFERYVAQELDRLGITREELDQQHRDGAFMSDRARHLWFFLP